MCTGNESSEHRCYVHLSLYNYPLLGMVDTDADRSYMDGRAVRLCQSLNIPIDKFTEPQCVQLANQSTAEVTGSVKRPIELQGKPSGLHKRDCHISTVLASRS
jgi:hypothetical protein